MPDKLGKCYYWHIITLALMKNKRNELKKRVSQIPTKVQN